MRKPAYFAVVVALFVATATASAENFVSGTNPRPQFVSGTNPRPRTASVAAPIDLGTFFSTVMGMFGF